LWGGYGARGINVCERWRDFKNFLADMGPSRGLTLERDRVNGDYEPGNCRWATMREQENNKRNTRWVVLNGEKKSLADWCRHFNLPYGTVAQRWNMGRTGASLFTPKNQGGKNGTRC
jgi:hypothetical protein